MYHSTGNKSTNKLIFVYTDNFVHLNLNMISMTLAKLYKNGSKDNTEKKEDI